MKIYLIIICVAVCLSCQNKDNIDILNKSLEKNIVIFIDKVDKNFPCKSNYITVEITGNKIYISNSVPTKANSYLGFKSVKKSMVYFYSTEDYSNFISVNSNEFKAVDKNYTNDCEPSMDQILLIDKKDKNYLKVYKIGMN